MKKLQYHFALIIKFLLILPLAGCLCTEKVEVLPQSLPNGTLGTPYYSEIDINFRVFKNFFITKLNQKTQGLNYLLLILEHIFSLMILK